MLILIGNKIKVEWPPSMAVNPVYNLKFTKGIPKNVQQRIRNVFPHNGFKSKGSKKA